MTHLEITERAFLDELEKIGGIGSFLGGGVSGIGKLLTGKASLGAVGRLGRVAYNQGAAGGGVLGGLKGLAKSQIGQMAAVPLAAGGALYAGHKLLGGGQRQQQGY